MKKFEIKALVPYIVGIVLFATLSMIYFYPVLEGYKIKQSDITLGKGMTKEIYSHRAKFYEEPLWSGNMFSGMPTYLTSTLYSGNIMYYLNKVMKLGLPHPIGILFAYMIGFFIFSLSLRIEPRIAIIGSIAYGLSSYFIIILEAGHNTKALSLAYLPPMIAGVISVLRGKELYGFVVFSLFLGLELYANHYQITYYSIFILFPIVLIHLVQLIKEKKGVLLLKRSGILLVGVLLAIGTNSGKLLTTYEYSKSSMRSQSELTVLPNGKSNENYKSTGLDKDYITQWSYGKEETLSLFLSNIKGGGSGAIIADQEEVERLQKEDPTFFNFLVKQYQENQNIVNTYWGDQPFTSGPVYVGIIIFFLAFLSLFFIKDKIVIALTAVSLLAIFLSWGKNLMWLTDFFVDYVPMYNKFRAVSTLLIIVEFTLPVLAILMLTELYNKGQELLLQKKKFIISSSIFVGILLLFFASPESFFTFLSNNEVNQFEAQIQQNPQLANSINVGLSQLEEYRIDVLKDDIMRALQLLLVFGVVLFLLIKGKINKNIAILLIGGLVLVDLWTIDKRYLNNDKSPGASQRSDSKYLSYERELNHQSPYSSSTIDQTILSNEIAQNPELKEIIDRAVAELKNESRGRLNKQDIERVQFDELMRNTHYRVLNSSVKMDEDAPTAYFHKNLGGYHGAKMKKYQELIDFHLGAEHYQLRQLFTQGGRSAVNSYLPQMKVTNMLNTKYIIGAITSEKGQQLAVVENRNRLGNAWFVNDIKAVKTADEEILEIREFNPRSTAIVREEDSKGISNNYSRTEADQISLTSYLPNKLVYNYQANMEQFAVFSEIFYKDGWNAYINGIKAGHIKVNYTLRGMSVPKGSGEIIFKFEPSSYRIGSIISWTSSLILVLVICLVVYKKVKKDPELT